MPCPTFPWLFVQTFSKRMVSDRFVSLSIYISIYIKITQWLDDMKFILC